MTKRVRTPDGYADFPDSMSDQEIEAVLRREYATQRNNQEAQARAQPQAPQGPNRAQATEAARIALARQQQRNALPGGFGAAAQPFINLATNPARQQTLGQSFQGFVNDVRQIPSLDWGQVGRDTAQSITQGVQNLPQTAGRLLMAAPQIAAELTGVPALMREERAQQDVDMAQIQGTDPRAAATRANAETANAALAIGGPFTLLGRPTVARTALTAAALDAPFALSRDNQRPLQERLPGALTEMTGAASFAGGAQGLVNAAPAISRVLPSRGARMVAHMDRAGASVDAAGNPVQPRGVRPDLASANEGIGVSGPTTKMVGDDIIAGVFVRPRVRQGLTDVRDAAHDIRDAYGRARSPEAAGGVLQRGMARTLRGPDDLPNPRGPGADPMRTPIREWSARSRAREVFDRVLRPIERNPATLNNTARELQALRARADSPDVQEFMRDRTITAVERLVGRMRRRTSDAFSPVDAEDIASIRAEIENARRAAGQAEQSLATFVRRKGGLRDDRGDIRGMDPSGRGVSSVLRQNGRTIDDMAIAAWEDGFFPGDTPPTAREFIDALGRDIATPGSFVRPGADGDAAANARQVLDYYERQGVDVNQRGSSLERTLRRLYGGESGNAPPPTLRDLREVRRRIRLMRDHPGQITGQTVDNAALGSLERALTEDIYEAAGPLADDLRRADTLYRRHMERIDELYRAFDPDNVDASVGFRNLIRAAQRRTENVHALAAARTALRDDEWRIIQASIIEELGQPPAGSAGFTQQQGFSVERFATNLNSISPRAWKVLFGSRGGQGNGNARIQRTLADDLENLRIVAGAKKGVERGANFSGSGRDVNNGLTLAFGLTSWPVAIGKVLALGVVGELLTNSAFVRWLVSSRNVQGPAGMRRHLALLRDIAARDPAVMPVYEGLQAQLQDPQQLRGPGAGDSPANSMRRTEELIQ